MKDYGAFPSPTLPQDVAQRLLAERDTAHDELGALIESVRGRDFTHAESIQLARLVRRADTRPVPSGPIGKFG
jgi:hypothetical protein